MIKQRSKEMMNGLHKKSTKQFPSKQHFVLPMSSNYNTLDSDQINLEHNIPYTISKRTTYKQKGTTEKTSKEKLDFRQNVRLTIYSDSQGRYVAIFGTNKQSQI